MDRADEQTRATEERPEQVEVMKLPDKRSPLVTVIALFYILLWSSAFIATKIGVTHSPSLTLLSARFLTAALLMGVLARLWKLPFPRGWRSWGSLLWFWLLKRGEASSVSAYYFLTPIAGLALAALLLGEHFGLREVLGLVAVAAGIALINRPAPRAPSVLK